MAKEFSDCGYSLPSFSVSLSVFFPCSKFDVVLCCAFFCSSSSYSAGGDLGAFGRGKMQKPFEDARLVCCQISSSLTLCSNSSLVFLSSFSFALRVGEISNVVLTESGAHIIYRYG
jgi:NIMA-interacting peptidyl-prolyl cis-trans isomerase 1